MDDFPCLFSGDIDDMPQTQKLALMAKLIAELNDSSDSMKKDHLDYVIYSYNRERQRLENLEK